MYGKQVVHHVKFNKEYAIYSTSVTEFELRTNIKIFESECKKIHTQKLIKVEKKQKQKK